MVELELVAGGGIETEDALKACLFLGHYHADRDDLPAANRYNEILMKFGGKVRAFVCTLVFRACIACACGACVCV